VAVRALMVDVDGVIVCRPHPAWRWDQDLEADLGVSPDALQTQFFGPHWQDVSLGRADLEARLAPVLATIAPHVAASSLMAYWFEKDAHLDHALLRDLKALRANGLQLHLATTQEHRRADYLWSDLRLRTLFDGLHHSAAVGHAKPDPAYFAAVEARCGMAPAELLLIDDSERNVDAALAWGWRAIAWTGQRRLTDLLADEGI
jgi:putative hydrolase of the HAD superfamily